MEINSDNICETCKIQSDNNQGIIAIQINGYQIPNPDKFTFLRKRGTLPMISDFQYINFKNKLQKHLKE